MAGIQHEYRIRAPWMYSFLLLLSLWMQQYFKNPRSIMCIERSHCKDTLRGNRASLKTGHKVTGKCWVSWFLLVTLSNCCNQTDYHLLWHLCHCLEVERGLRLYLNTVHFPISVATLRITRKQIRRRALHRGSGQIRLLASLLFVMIMILKILAQTT